MKQKYIEIEKELISKYKILIIENSSCRSRMHAHCDGSRRICKWSPSNSIVSLFELAHEIGHIMTKTSKMRRCESEFYATVWAIQELNKYEEVVHHWADKMEPMDLDDGVKANYAKFQELLAKIK